MNSFFPASALVAFPIAAFFAMGCSGDPSQEQQSTVAAAAGAASVASQAESARPATDPAGADGYRGPSVGAAKGFAALAQTAITALGNSPVTGNLGVSGASVHSITGFDAVPALKFGIDSSAPNSLRTILTQREVDALVDDIDVRACDANYAALSDGMTLHPGVSCVASDLQLSGRLTLDAGGDPNAFFVIRSNSAMNLADQTVLVLEN
ncbi:MAG TPA: ice-binding family protein, partial [Polyangiaceae bacterium]